MLCLLIGFLPEDRVMKKLLCLILMLIPCAAFAQLGDITNSMTFMGNPFSGQWLDDSKEVYARDVWIMKFIGISACPACQVPDPDRIYFGSGTYEPFNSGPTYVAYLLARPVINCTGAPAQNCGFNLFYPPLDTHEIS